MGHLAVGDSPRGPPRNGCRSVDSPDGGGTDFCLARVMLRTSQSEFPPEVIGLARIRLRRPKASDADAIFEYGSDPEVARYTDWRTRSTVESVRESLGRREEQWNSGSEFTWVITIPTEDRAIGTIGCSLSGHCAEFGFVLNRRVWGNGYATEASRAIVNWIFSVPSIWRLSATCDRDNVASARVLEKSGLSLEGILRRSVIRPNLGNEPRDSFLYSKVRE